MPRLALMAALALSTSGCGSGVSPRDFELKRNQIVCEAIYRCCDSSHGALLGNTVDGCVMLKNQTVDTSAADQAIAGGFIKWDSGLAQQCLDAIRANFSDCTNPVPPIAPDPCPQVAIGTVQVPDSCDQTLAECAPDLFCIATNAPPAPGECTKMAQLGESCLDVPCVVGLGCNKVHVCVNPAPDGSACGADGECASDRCVGSFCAPLATVTASICS